ncbi:hypothetical protein [Streptomyces heilongjiangensis]|uniref:Uncharacterized protein n=1 Tax=Streptomyces heilongjiangensis TaxID=945052 RepID=A0ABW1AYW2_9ACTN|nr:hypothetical protein [Streptomyces heilongjiangensis]MDC2947902.1 hypothetical protein [Streptomyces heilongjiangensis]
MDALEGGVTALWEAVVSREPAHARVPAAAGADPWRPLLGGCAGGPPASGVAVLSLRPTRRHLGL